MFAQFTLFLTIGAMLYAYHQHFPLATACRDRGRSDDQRRDALDIGYGAQGLCVTQRQVTRGLAAEQSRLDTGGFRTARNDDDQARAEDLELPRHVAPRRLSQTGKDNDCGDTNPHREQQH